MKTCTQQARQGVLGARVDPNDAHNRTAIKSRRSTWIFFRWALLLGKGVGRYFGDTPKHTNKEKNMRGKGAKEMLGETLWIPHIYWKTWAKCGSVMFVLRMLPQVLWCLFDYVLVLIKKTGGCALCGSSYFSVAKCSQEFIRGFVLIQHCSIMIRTKTNPFYVGASILFLIAGKGYLSTLESICTFQLQIHMACFQPILYGKLIPQYFHNDMRTIKKPDTQWDVKSFPGSFHSNPSFGPMFVQNSTEKDILCTHMRGTFFGRHLSRTGRRF